MVPHQWPVALVVIWHIYSCLACSSDDSARDLPPGKVVLGQRQVPCEFWADQPNFIFQPVVPDVIGQPSFFSWWLLTWFGTFTHTCTAPWGMVVGTCCLQGEQPLPWGRSPVIFMQIGQTSFLSWWLLTWFAHIYSGQHCFNGGFRYGPAVFKGWCPHDGAGPLWVLRRSAKLHFSANGSWHDSAHLLWAGLKVWTCHLQGILHSPGDLQETFPRPSSTSPEDGKWMALSPVKQHCLD